MTEITNTCLTYSVKEIADKLGVSVGQAYKLVREDKVPNIKFGKRYIVPIKQFNEWLDSTCKVGDFL